MQPLTRQQIAFFDAFGYLHLPGLMRGRIDELTRAFHEVWERRGHVHGGQQRSAILAFIDQHETLCSLLDDPRIEGLAASLLGDDFNYMGSDGNYYVGDTRWHCDSFQSRRFVKIAFYLDRVTRDTGALRVIPGSHVVTPAREALGEMVVRSEETLGVPGRDVPAAALESEPGDVVCFHHTALHASYGGSDRRRMFTIDAGQRYRDDDAEDLRKYLRIFTRKGVERIYGDTMVATAGPRRMLHLEQVLAQSRKLAREPAPAQ